LISREGAKAAKKGASFKPSRASREIFNFARDHGHELRIVGADQMTIAELLLTDLAWEFPATRKILARVPADKFDWKPADDLHTIAWNANHLVDVAGWTPMILETTELDLAPVGGLAQATSSFTEPVALLAKYDANVAATRKSLQGVGDPKMAELWSLKAAGQTILTMNKGDCLRKWIVSHMSHHRAILATYLRLAGIKLGSIFEE
jgi:uncharacterized damage-inducible protein DinB